MAKLYILPLYDEVKKPYTSHSSMNAYRKAQFEKYISPTFGNNARLEIPKYEKVGDQKDYERNCWYRIPYFASKYFHNDVNVTIQSYPLESKKEVSLVLNDNTLKSSDMVSCIDVPVGFCKVNVTLRAYLQSDPNGIKESVKKGQKAIDNCKINVWIREGYNFLVLTHKVQLGILYDENSIRGNYFEYHSAEARITTRSDFMKHINKYYFPKLFIPNYEPYDSLEDSKIINKKEDKPIAKVQQEVKQKEIKPILEVKQNKEVKKNNNIQKEIKKPVINEKKKELNYWEKEPFLTNMKPFEYTVINGVVTINKIKEAKEEMVIPEGVGVIGSKVSIIDVNDNVIKKLTIPSSVTKIDEFAFEHNVSLEEVVINANIDIIETGVFKDCYSLKKITFPKSLKVIGDYSFIRSSFEEIVIPEGCMEIRQNAFFQNKKLKKVMIPKSCKKIEKSVFQSCSLEEVIVPKDCILYKDAFDKSVKIYYGEKPKEEVTELKPLEVKTDSIKSNKVTKKTTQEKANIEPKVEKVKEEKQKENALKENDLKENDLKENAFKENVLKENALKENSLKENALKENAFKENALKENVLKENDVIKTENKLTDNQVAKIIEDNDNAKTLNKSIITKDKNKKAKKGDSLKLEKEVKGENNVLNDVVIEHHKYCRNGVLNDLVLGDEVYKIRVGAFEENFTLKSIKLNDKLSIIEDKAFKGTKIKNIRIPKSVTELGESVFENCKFLESVNFESLFNVNTLKKNTFKNCKSLKEINLNSFSYFEEGALMFTNIEDLRLFNVKELPLGSLANLGNLKSIYINTGSQIKSEQFDKKKMEFPALIDGDLYDIVNGMVTLVQACVGKGITEYNNKFVEMIGDYAFANCNSLTKINLPKVNEIKTGAFMNCKNLVDLRFGSKLEHIYNYAFEGCNKLTNVVLPRKCSLIGSSFEENKHFPTTCIVKKKKLFGL